MSSRFEGDDVVLLQGGEYVMKKCPQCGAEVFADMNVCYACLYEFPKVVVPKPPRELPEEQVPTEAYEVPSSEELPDDQPPAKRISICSRSLDVTLAMPREGLVVGRGSECEVLVHNRAVSRKHVRLWQEDDKVYVRDLGARNPATINDVPMSTHDSVCLQERDTLKVCGVRITLDTPTEPDEIPF